MTVEGNSLEYAEDFARLAEQLLAEPQEQPTLERIVGLAVQVVDPCDYCAITLKESDGRLTTPASTDPIATQAAELENRLHEGPCLDAIWHLGTVDVDDMEVETRWPRWAPAAADLGIRSMLSVRLDLTEPVRLPTRPIRLHRSRNCQHLCPARRASPRRCAHPGGAPVGGAIPPDHWGRRRHVDGTVWADTRPGLRATPSIFSDL